MENFMVPFRSKCFVILLSVVVLTVSIGVQVENAYAKKTILSFITWRGDDSEAYDRVIAAFQKENPDIEVNVEYLKGGTTYDGIVSTRGMGGELDIYAAQPGGQLSAYVKAGYAVDLTGQPFIERVVPGAAAAATIDGKTYGVSQGMSTICVFYNKQMFEERGLSVPTTWEEFLEICETFKKDGITPLVAGFAQPYIAQNLYKMMSSHLDPEGSPNWWIKVSDKEMTLRDEPFPTLMKAMNSLYEKGYYVKGVEGIDKHGAAALFAQGRAAMDIEGTWRASTIAEADGAPEFGIFGVPFQGDPNEKVSIVHPNQAHLIFPQSKNKEAALKFYDFMMTNEMMDIYSNISKQGPVGLKAVIESPVMQMISEFIKNTRPVLGPNLANPNTEVQNTIYEALTRIAIGQDVDTVIEEMQAKIDGVER
ncbi:MAG: extracellular solute-binding protein [bacterium]|nr:extracellular solute-binding protein [bacterium]